MKFYTAVPNAVKVVSIFMKDLDIKVAPYTIEKDLLEHPDYPNMLALSDCLTAWNVPNEAVRIERNAGNLTEIAYPIIVHLEQEGGQYAVVHRISNEHVIFSNEKKNEEPLLISDFIKIWDGILLYAEKNVSSGEKDYTGSLIKGWLDKTRLPFLLSIVSVCVGYRIFTMQADLEYNLLLMLKLFATVISCILLTESVNATNPFIANLCSLGKRNNCNAILKSDAAKVTSWLNWSEVGLFYFTGTSLCLLFFPRTVMLLGILNILCLPYTIYSIGFQIKIKNWCILCCSIQVILWLEALLFNSIGYSSFPLAGYDVINILLCLSIPVAIWAFLKPYLFKAGQVRPLQRQLKALKYNDEVFKKILTSQKKHIIPNDLSPIILGNPDANTIITMVSNPFCGPCAQAHEILDEWIAEVDDIKLQILFTTANDDNDHRTKVARHVTALSLLADRQVVRNALNDWYSQKNKKYVSWANKYPADLPRLDAVTKRQKEWCDMAEISYTPTILINGYKLGGPYDLKDVKYFLTN